jgi:endonuclease-3
MRMTKKKRAQEALRRLGQVFPNAHCELLFQNTFQLMVAVQLSAQCTDKRVNQITPALFKRIKNWNDLAEISQLELERYVFSTGFYRNKAKNLRAAARYILDEYGGELPQNMNDLLWIPGVARKTANVVLETGFGIVEGIVVDTHVRRITHLLKLTKHNTAEKIEQDLMHLLPEKEWGEVGHLLVWHGRRTCIARKPDCEHCCLADICPSSAVSAR